MYRDSRKVKSFRIGVNLNLYQMQQLREAAGDEPIAAVLARLAFEHPQLQIPTEQKSERKHAA